MTLSALANSLAGTVSPCAFAVLRLMDNTPLYGTRTQMPGIPVGGGDRPMSDVNAELATTCQPGVAEELSFSRAAERCAIAMTLNGSEICIIKGHLRKYLLPSEFISAGYGDSNILA